MKTVSLELSKRLKEAGYPEENSYMVWVEVFPIFNDELRLVTHAQFEQQLKGSILSDEAKKLIKYFASPTADEILKHLPEYYVIYWLGKRAVCRDAREFDDEFPSEDMHYFQGESLADAAARMYLYLKKQGLL